MSAWQVPLNETTLTVAVLFVMAPAAAGTIGAVIAGAGRLRQGAVWGAAGGGVFGLALAPFGGFAYGPVLGALGGLLAPVLFPPPPRPAGPSDWHSPPPLPPEKTSGIGNDRPRLG
jgi:hypothetical protein